MALFEKKMDLSFDSIICVYSKSQIQVERLIKRDNIDFDLAKQMLKSQISIEKKKEFSQFVIVNETDLSELRDRVRAIVEEILLVV